MTETKKPRAPRKKKQETEVPAEENKNVNISLEQILASILATLKTVEVNIDTLLKDYSGMQIGVSQEGDKVFFELVEGNHE